MTTVENYLLPFLSCMVHQGAMYVQYFSLGKLQYCRNAHLRVCNSNSGLSSYFSFASNACWIFLVPVLGTSIFLWVHWISFSHKTNISNSNIFNMRCMQRFRVVMGRIERNKTPLKTPCCEAISLPVIQRLYKV